MIGNDNEAPSAPAENSLSDKINRHGVTVADMEAWAKVERCLFDEPDHPPSLRRALLRAVDWKFGRRAIQS